MTSTQTEGYRLTFRDRGRLHRLRRRVRNGEVSDWFSRHELAFMELVRREIAAGILTEVCEDENSTFWAETPHY